MAAPRVTSSSFVKAYKERSRSLVKLAKGASLELAPEAVHDLRVTSRRLQIMTKLLPRRERSSDQVKAFDSALKTLLKDTSAVRDADTLAQTLKPYGSMLSPDFTRSLQLEREREAERAQAQIRSLTLVLESWGRLPRAETRGLTRRFRQRVKKCGRSLDDVLRMVTEDESKVAELHSLRKQVKKLRYLLELTPGRSGALAALERWQEELGLVHDLDVAIQFAADNLTPFRFAKALEALKRRRHLAYLRFCRESRKDAAVLRGLLG